MSSPNSPTFVLRDSAREHIQSVALYLGRTKRQKAVAWLSNVKATIDELTEHPNLGVSYRSSQVALHSLRRYRVRNHQRYWIYYRAFASGNGIEVIAVLNESQDIASQLESALKS